MAKAQKAKRGKRAGHVVMYVRVKREEHARIIKIAKRRGYPATISSVASEVISRGLTASSEAQQGLPVLP